MLMTSSTNMFLRTLICAACHRHLVTSSRTLWTLVVVVLCGLLAGVGGVSVTSGGGSRGHVVSSPSSTSSVASSERSCRQAVERFDSFKLSITHAVPQNKIRPSPALEVCSPSQSGGVSCCTRTLERHLHQLAVDGARRAVMSSPAFSRLTDVISATLLHRAKLVHLLAVVSNSTRNILSTVYRVKEHGSIDRLVASLTQYLVTGDIDVRLAVNTFFDQLFAAIVLPHDAPGSRAFDCVAASRSSLSASAVPFDGQAIHLGDDLIRSLGVARVLLDSFSLAEDILSWAGSVQLDHQCSRALTRLRHCALCDGLSELTVRPCRSLCTNVARGCLFRLATGAVASRWALFVSNVGDLTGSVGGGSYDIERVLYKLERSLPIEVGRMLAVHHEYTAQIVSKCGVVNVRHQSQSPPPPVTDDDQLQQQQLDRLGIKSLMSGIRISARDLMLSKTFFQRLPDAFCGDVILNVSDSDDNCWTGSAVDRYNHSVPLLDERAQMTSNPEMRVSNMSSDEESILSARIDETTKLLHSRRPPRVPPSYPDPSDGSGYHVSSWYPEDDEDGFSGSGDWSSGEPDSTESDTPSQPVVTRGDIEFHSSTASSALVYITTSVRSPSHQHPTAAASSLSIIAPSSCCQLMATSILLLLTLLIQRHL